MSRRPDVLIGHELPRIMTKPLRPLTEETTNGFKVIRFAEQLAAAGAKDDLGRPLRLFPWQKQALIRALELREDGTYRFRVVLILVARQNGKTTLVKLLTLWRMLHDNARVVVGTSTNMEYAREAWAATVELAANRDRVLAARRARCVFADIAGAELDVDAELLKWLPPRERWVRWAKGPLPAKYGALDTSLTLTNEHRYKTATASRTGARSLSVDLGLADELREHREKGELTGWEAWAALDGATTARPNAQVWGLSNAGDDGSIVLNQLRAGAIDFIETGEGDDAICILEWSGPDGCEIDDRQAWAAANPALGHGTITEATLASKSRLPAHVFRTEHLCQGVPTLRVAIPEAALKACVDDAVTLNSVRRRVAVVVDVSPDLQHVSLMAAGVGDDGRVRLETIAAWKSPNESRGAATVDGSLRWWLRKINPKVIGWLPDGPAAAIATDMAAISKGRTNVHELRGAEVGQACQGLAEQVQAGKVAFRRDPMFMAQAASANKWQSGDGWRFVRRGAGHVDAVYAAAGAVHLARLIPRPKRQRMVTTASGTAA